MTTVVKTMTDSQFAWSVRKGFIWEAAPGMWVSKRYYYSWMPPFVDKNGEDAGGCWWVTENR
jgi:hypothetical protein